MTALTPGIANPHTGTEPATDVTCAQALCSRKGSPFPTLQIDNHGSQSAASVREFLSVLPFGRDGIVVVGWVSAHQDRTSPALRVICHPYPHTVDCKL